MRKGERGKGMGQCFVASHTVGSPDKGQCKLKKCAESSHCFVRKPSHNSLCGRIRKREERKAFGCGAILMKEFCANKKTSAPSPSPFPLFSPWAGQLLSSLPMGEKKGKGEGDGADHFVAPTQWATQTGSEGHHKFVHNSVIVKGQTQVKNLVHTETDSAQPR